MGSASRSDIKAGMAAMSSLRENTVSAYIITSVAQKHVSLVGYLCSNCKIDTLYMPQYVTESQAVITNAAEREACRFGVKVEYFSFGESFLCDGTEVLVSELEYISRSTLPLYALSMIKDGKEILWVSGAYFEGSKSGFALSRRPEIMIYGAYGAKTRPDYSPDVNAIGAGGYIIPNKKLYSAFSNKVIFEMQKTGLELSDGMYFHYPKTK